ncbi:MAG: peptide-methionine (S)-S-oxide reductase MsrA [Verrucomicrobiae bacterium]|nr:peptide-methionine (S)-S-oxide reductase MsrA [Verrucomicrobiae bacterium]
MTFPTSFSITRPLAIFSFFSICAASAVGLCSCDEKDTSPETPADQPTAAEPAKTPEVKNEILSSPAPAAPAEATDTSQNAGAADVKSEEKKADTEPKTALATFGGGCFWCTEAVMERLEGVVDVKSGYMGGHVENPTYEQVCEKTTGHVEVIQVTYDPKAISYSELLDVFWQAHDPTTWDQQGADKGPQYRSAIFTHTPEQKAEAENSKNQLNKSGTLSSPVVTEIRDAVKFWEAEDYHQDFYKNNPNYGYCRAVISPKLKKLKME